MKKWMIEILIDLLSNYITVDNMKKLDAAVKKYVLVKLKEFAKSTKETDIDDKLVEKIDRAWQTK